MKTPEKDVVSEESLITPEKDVVPIREPMKTPEKDVVSEESLITPEKDVVPIGKEPLKTLENEELPNLLDVPVKQLKDVEEFSSDVLLQERLDKIKEFRRNLEMEKTKVLLCDKPIDHLVRDNTSDKVGDEKGKYKNKKIVPSYNNRNKHTGISQNTSQNNDR